MICKYFNENHAIYCDSSLFPHVPNVVEMEMLCFKDFCRCSFYSGVIACDRTCEETDGGLNFDPPAMHPGWA